MTEKPSELPPIPSYHDAYGSFADLSDEARNVMLEDAFDYLPDNAEVMDLALDVALGRVDPTESAEWQTEYARNKLAVESYASREQNPGILGAYTSVVSRHPYLGAVPIRIIPQQSTQLEAMASYEHRPGVFIEFTFLHQGEELEVGGPIGQRLMDLRLKSWAEKGLEIATSDLNKIQTMALLHELGHISDVIEIGKMRGGGYGEAVAALTNLYAELDEEFLPIPDNDFRVYATPNEVFEENKDRLVERFGITAPEQLIEAQLKSIIGVLYEQTPDEFAVAEYQAFEESQLLAAA
jgi:hypothetical protein